MNEGQPADEYTRIGDLSKCPACGAAVDTEAYHCAKCRADYCFKCRVQLRHVVAQFQCADQTCLKYGKRICAACTVLVPDIQDVRERRYNVVAAATGGKTKLTGCGIVVVVLGVFAASLIIIYMGLASKEGFDVGSSALHKAEAKRTSDIVLGSICAIFNAFLAFLISIAVLSFVTQFVNIPESWLTRKTPVVPELREYYEVVEKKKVAEHRCCMQCRHPAMVLRTEAT